MYVGYPGVVFEPDHLRPVVSFTGMVFIAPNEDLSFFLSRHAFRFRRSLGFVVSFSYRCLCDPLCSSIVSHGAPAMSSVILHGAPIMIRVSYVVASIFISHPYFCFRFRIVRPVSLYSIPGQ